MTRLFGVIGHPVGHSLSPAMQTAALEALRLDACYGAFDVPPRFLRPILRALTLSGLEGLNVTVPLKQAVIPLLDRLDPSAKAIGAVNTIVIGNRRLAGYNTDGTAFREALKQDLKITARGKRVLLLGAGGAARAVAWALAGMKPRAITVANRTASRALGLARWLEHSAKTPASAVRWRASALRTAVQHAELIINATTVGMRPGDGPPVDPAWLRRSAGVYDLVYHRQTALVRAARRRGCIASGGLSMLLYQGAESLRLWTHRTPPIEVMRRALGRAVERLG
jgi:shikimate dehydrogenase